MATGIGKAVRDKIGRLPNGWSAVESGADPRSPSARGGGDQATAKRVDPPQPASCLPECPQPPEISRSSCSTFSTAAVMCAG